MDATMLLGSNVNALLNLVSGHIIMGYLGPGAAISSLGAFLALIAGIIVAFLGFLWYPIRRLMRKLRNPDDHEEGNTEA